MISVIIIVKNDLKIAAVLQQLQIIKKPEKIEIIIVDASKGNLQHIKEKFPAVNWIDFVSKTKKRVTIPEQRNVGIKQAKGDIIVFIDSDCKPFTDWLVELVTPIRKDSEAIVAGVVKVADERSLHNLDQKKNINKKYIDECPTMNVAIKKDVFKTIGMYDETFQFGSDMDFCWRARMAGYKIRLNEQAIISHDLGTMKHDMRRMYFYGKARVTLYRKHRDRWKFFMHELHILLYPLYFILLPLTCVVAFYPLVLLFPLVKYRNQRPLRIIIMKTIYGTGFLTQLLVQR